MRSLPHSPRGPERGRADGIIDDSALARIEALTTEYRRTWGREPDLTLVLCHPGITQERLAAVLERMISTGESALTAYMALKNDALQ